MANIMRGEVDLRPSLSKTIPLKISAAAVQHFEANAGMPLSAVPRNIGVTAMVHLLIAGTQHLSTPLTQEKAQAILDDLPWKDDPEVVAGELHDQETVWQLVMLALTRSLPGVKKANFIERAREAGLGVEHGLPPEDPSTKEKGDAPESGE